VKNLELSLKEGGECREGGSVENSTVWAELRSCKKELRECRKHLEDVQKALQVETKAREEAEELYGRVRKVLRECQESHPSIPRYMPGESGYHLAYEQN
jgi:septation ring formation regulator EzrA